MTTTQLIPILAVPVLLWRFYRRFRRNVGRQVFHPARMITFICAVSLLVAVLGFFSRYQSAAVLGLAAGVVLGAVVAVVGLKLTTFGTDKRGKFYIPNAYLGVLLTLLLATRLIYRYVVLYHGSSGFASSRTHVTPLTLAVLGLTFGYYVIYYSGILLHFKGKALNEAPGE